MHAFNIKLAKIVTVKKRNLEIISDFPQCNNVKLISTLLIVIWERFIYTINALVYMCLEKIHIR